MYKIGPFEHLSTFWYQKYQTGHHIIIWVFRFFRICHLKNQLLVFLVSKRTWMVKWTNFIHMLLLTDVLNICSILAHNLWAIRKSISGSGQIFLNRKILYQNDRRDENAIRSHNIKIEFSTQKSTLKVEP